MMNLPVVSSCVVAALAMLYYYDLLCTTFTLCMHVAFGSLGIYLGVSWGLIRGKQYVPPALPKELKISHVRLVLQNMMEARAFHQSGPKKVVISRNMDLALQDIIDLVLRDFILDWYKDLSLDHDSLLSYLECDLWVVIENISERLTKIDKVQFMTQDVVQELKTHFQDIRIASGKNPEEGQQRTFSLHPWLKSREAELNFLRKVSEALLLVVLPKYYAKSPPIRHLLREVVANTVLKPTIELICDPDYINMKLITFIEYREKVSEDTRRTYTYAATYEDFVKMIKKSEDIEHLKQLRFNIMTEIMQATTIDKLKKTKTEKAESPKRSQAKGELLKQRNLKRYVNQLTVAKSCCEKRIHRLSGPDYKYYYKYYTTGLDDSQQKTVLPGEKVLPFAEIMQSSAGREYFELFLERDNNESLLGFWNSVEKLKHADKKQLHHLATEVYQRYISSPTSVVKVDKHTLKAMETFMLGDSGPEAFFSAQDVVYKSLEEKHYPSFLVSDLYHRYLTSDDDATGGTTGAERKDTLFFEPTEEDVEDEEMFTLQCYHAKQKLQLLGAKITNKSQAFDALRISKPKPDTKLQKVQDELESELEAMKEEKRKLESHLLRTEQWCSNTGLWKAHVYGTETEKQGDKTIPVFVLVIHLSGTSFTSQNLQNSSQGWVVNRRLQDFYNVHEKLVQIAGPWLKNKELPKINMFTTVDKKFLQDAKTTLNEYLSAIMKDDRMSNSEALYGFLTPTPEYFQQPGQEKKGGFFLKNILKSLPTIGGDSNREPEEDLIFSYDERTEDRSKDSIAEPLYGLINEVYELTGMFKWLRKNFIAFVEVTFGRSINRQLRETVDWIFSEPMIIYYIRNLKDSMWPNGVLAEATPPHSDEEKLRVRLKAKEKFMLIQPDAIKSLVGEDNAKRGTIKMFEVLQDVRLNKHLFYNVFLLLMDRMIPELKVLMSEHRTNSASPLIISGSDYLVESKTT